MLMMHFETSQERSSLVPRLRKFDCRVENHVQQRRKKVHQIEHLLGRRFVSICKTAFVDFLAIFAELLPNCFWRHVRILHFLKHLFALLLEKECQFEVIFKLVPQWIIFHACFASTDEMIFFQQFRLSFFLRFISELKSKKVNSLINQSIRNKESITYP